MRIILDFIPCLEIPFPLQYPWILWENSTSPYVFSVDKCSYWSCLVINRCVIFGCLTKNPCLCDSDTCICLTVTPVSVWQWHLHLCDNDTCICVATTSVMARPGFPCQPVVTVPPCSLPSPPPPTFHHLDVARICLLLRPTTCSVQLNQECSRELTAIFSRLRSQWQWLCQF